ncbi:MAG: MiaB/RimO family radical SAM methylthiotransferase [Candidatus Omnitrophica bacterium]|nr:MiaB/RimO family radical SAM methylthiotransferase [Candidatus Omnitrophota bacterium]
MMFKQKIGILSLGCPRNLVDAESLAGRLRDKGYGIVDIAKSDTAILNTCCFIESAKKESIDAILELVDLKKQGKIKRIVLAGCLAQRYRESLQKEIPEIDAFLGPPSLNHGTGRFPLTEKHFAYLKICESCVHNCSYCVIPKIKGKFSSLGLDSVLQKVSLFNREKISELNIIGQDITGYGLDLYGKKILAEALKKILGKAKNIHWVRLLYLYPGKEVEGILKIIRDEPKVCKYIDLPIQHINGRILKLMQRKTSKSDILRLIDKIRKVIPEAAIRTSVIVGFPSEKDAEFEELLTFLRQAQFDRLGAFIYSREEGTKAFDFKGQLPEKTKQERFDRVMLMQQQVSSALNRKFLGKTIEVLIDERQGKQYLGRSQYDAPEVDGQVYVNSKRALKPGDFAQVQITDTLEYDLVGTAVEKEGRHDEYCQ